MGGLEMEGLEMGDELSSVLQLEKKPNPITADMAIIPTHFDSVFIGEIP